MTTTEACDTGHTYCLLPSLVALKNSGTKRGKEGLLHFLTIMRSIFCDTEEVQEQHNTRVSEDFYKKSSGSISNPFLNVEQENRSTTLI